MLIQGDQIGRIFAIWVIVYFEQYGLKIIKVYIVFGIHLKGKSYVCTFGKIWVELHFGRLLK
jgi:hypothetical protein